MSAGNYFLSYNSDRPDRNFVFFCSLFSFLKSYSHKKLIFIQSFHLST